MRPEVLVGELVTHRLRRGSRARIYLHQTVRDRVGRDVVGPHPVGVVRRDEHGEVHVRFVATQAARDARALLEDGLLAVDVDGGGNIRLR